MDTAHTTRPLRDAAIWLAALVVLGALVAGVYWWIHRPAPRPEPATTTTTVALDVQVWDNAYTVCDVLGVDEIARQRGARPNPNDVAEIVGSDYVEPLDEVARDGCFTALTGQPNRNPHR